MAINAKGSALPNVLSYTNYLSFLEDAYLIKRDLDPQFSYSYIASTCGFRSRTQVRSIFKGSLVPSLSQLKKIANVLGLPAREETYLQSLFQFNSAKDSRLAFDLFQQLIDQQSQEEIQDNPFRELESATSLLHLTILSLAECVEFKADEKWIAEHLNFEYSQEQVEAALGELISFERIVWDAEKHRYTPAQSYVKKIDKQANFFLRKFHRECLEKALISIDNKPMEDRFLIGSTIAIPKQSFPRIQQKIGAFLDSLVRSEKRSADKTEVVQVNVQLLRIANIDLTTSDIMLHQSMETTSNDTQPKGIVARPAMIGVDIKEKAK